MPNEWRGSYFDGRTAARHSAIVRVMGTGLELTIEGGRTLWWPFAEIRQSQGSYAGEQVRLERGGAIAEALVVPDAAFLTELHRVAPDLTRRLHDPARRPLRRQLTLLAALATIAVVVGLYRWGVPAFAVLAAAIVPVSWEEALGARVMSSLVPPERRCSDPARLRAVEQIVSTLVASRPSRYRFHVVVVNDRIVNAFAAPGGYVVVFKGLLDRTRTPEELAGVLAHEIAHVLERHATRAIVQHVSTGLLLSALIGDATGSLAYGVEAARVLGDLQYSRHNEEEADREGIRLLLDARIDPSGMIAFFEGLQRSDRAQSRLPRYLSTHPPTQDRVARLRSLAARSSAPPVKLLPGYDWSDLRAICPSSPPP